MNQLASSGVTLRMPLALLVVSGLVTGVALTANDASTARVETPSIGAWLGTDDTGVVSHVGPAGIDASVEIRPPVGQLRVHVVDGHVVLADDGGNVTRLDDAALDVGTEEEIATSARLAGGGDRLYTIDIDENTVQEINPADLLPIGEPVRFETGPGGAGLGDAVVDDDGTLWVANAADGSVVEMIGGEITARHDVATSGVRLDLALTDAGAIAIDPAAGTVQLIEDGTPHQLPFAPPMLAPDHVDGTAILPVVADGQVALIDPGSGAIDLVELGVGDNELGLPVVAGDRVLVPDLTDGLLHVVELDTATIADDIDLPEQTSDFEMISDGEVAYVNDRTSEQVWIIAPDGSVTRDDKFDPNALDEGATPAAEPGEADETDDIAFPPPSGTPPSAVPTPRPPPPAQPAQPDPPPPVGAPSATPPTTPDNLPSEPTNTDPATTDPSDASTAGDGSVTIDRVSADVSRATVSWSAPTNWLAVDRYLVRVLDADGNLVQEQPLGPDVTTFEALGLTNGVDHRFEITASSGRTVGVPVVSTAVRPDVLGEGSVANLRATADDGSVTAEWAAPVGWYDVAEYVVVVTGPSGDVDVEQVDGDVFAFTSTSVTNGTTYVITVHAVATGAQVGPDATSNPVTPISLVPSGDGNVSITDTSVGDGTASVTWTEPTDWYTVTGYDIVVLNDDDSQYNAAGINLSGTTVAIDGLVNGRTYRAQITALSDQGAGRLTVSTPLAPLGNGAVTNLVAAAGDSQVQASWAPPAGWGTISGYTVSISPGGITESLPPTATTYERRGLTNGQTYTLQITASRASGPDGATTTSTPFTPAADLPSAPLNVTVLAGSGSIQLTWNAPATGNVGSFRIDALPTDGSTGATQTVAGSRTSVEIRNLTNGQAYDVTIRAAHPNGPLGAPATLNNITPSGRPDAPGIASAPTSSTDGTSVTLRWSAPNNNGSALTDFLINGQQVGGPTVASDVVVAPGATSFTVNGLQPATTYSFSVLARNGVGRSDAADFTNITTAAPATPAPNQPQNLQGVGALTHVDLTWAAPAPNGATINAYEVSISGASPMTLPAGALSYRWTGLASSTSYTFVVRAVGADNQLGAPTSFTTSTTSPPTTQPPAPSVPTNVSAGALSQTSARITWSQPNPANTSSWIIGFNSGRWTSSTTSIDLTGLQPGTTYQILVWSVGPTGLQSGPSSAISVTTATPPPIPGPVTGLNASVEWQLFDLTWNAVTGASGYRVAIDGGAAVDVGNTTSFFRGNFTSDNGTVTVWAYNGSGTGPGTTVNYADFCPGPIAC